MLCCAVTCLAAPHFVWTRVAVLCVAARWGIVLLSEPRHTVTARPSSRAPEQALHVRLEAPPATHHAHLFLHHAQLARRPLGPWWPDAISPSTRAHSVAAPASRSALLSRPHSRRLRHCPAPRTLPASPRRRGLARGRPPTQAAAVGCASTASRGAAAPATAATAREEAPLAAASPQASPAPMATPHPPLTTGASRCDPCRLSCRSRPHRPRH